MIDILLDTNIVIYMMEQNAMYLSFVKNIGAKSVGISVITYTEVLVGADTAEHAVQLQELLDTVEIVPFDRSIAFDCATVLRRSTRKTLRNPRFADMIIGQTALSLNVPLVTNNPKDFKVFKGLKLLVPV